MSDAEIELTEQDKLSPEKGAGLEALRSRGASVAPPPPPVVSVGPAVSPDVAAVPAVAAEPVPETPKPPAKKAKAGSKKPKAKAASAKPVASGDLIGSLVGERRVVVVNLAGPLREAVDRAAADNEMTVGDATMVAVRAQHGAVREANSGGEVADDGFAPPRVKVRQSRAGTKQRTSITVSDGEAQALMDLAADTAMSVTLAIEECVRLHYEA